MNLIASIIATSGERTLNENTKVDLKGSWTKFENAVSSATGIGSLLNILAIFGMLLIASAFIKWAWDRRKSGGMGGGGGGGGAITGALIVGIVLSAPGFVIPAVLGVFDLFINAIVSIWNNNKVQG